MAPPIVIPGDLADERVRLRGIAERDIPDFLNAHEEDRDLARLIGMSRPPSAAELGRGIERAGEELETGTRAELTITAARADDAIGSVVLHTIAWERGRAGIGIWVAPWARRRGAGRSALGLTAGWAFGRLGLRRLELMTGPDNEPMIALARELGFSAEGVLKSFLAEHAEPVDRAVFALVREAG